MFLDSFISLLQSMINSPHAYEQNKAFTKHIVDAMMKALEEKLELEVSIPWWMGTYYQIQDKKLWVFCFMWLGC